MKGLSVVIGGAGLGADSTGIIDLNFEEAEAAPGRVAALINSAAMYPRIPILQNTFADRDF